MAPGYCRVLSAGAYHFRTVLPGPMPNRCRVFTGPELQQVPETRPGLHHQQH